MFCTLTTQQSHPDEKVSNDNECSLKKEREKERMPFPVLRLACGMRLVKVQYASDGSTSPGIGCNCLAGASEFVETTIVPEMLQPG